MHEIDRGFWRYQRNKLYGQVQVQFCLSVVLTKIITNPHRFEAHKMCVFPISNRHITNFDDFPIEKHVFCVVFSRSKKENGEKNALTDCYSGHKEPPCCKFLHTWHDQAKIAPIFTQKKKRLFRDNKMLLILCSPAVVYTK